MLVCNGSKYSGIAYCIRTETITLHVQVFVGAVSFSIIPVTERLLFTNADS